MNFFEQTRYRINKVTLSLVGLWPYQEKRHRRLFLSLTLIFTSTMVSAQIRKVMIDYDNPDTILGAISPFLVDFVCTVKVISSLVYEPELIQILERVKTDVNAKMGPERTALATCIYHGQLFCAAYAVALYSLMIGFLLLPAIPKIFVAIGLSNETAPAQFPFPVDYGIDLDEIFPYVQVHICIGVFYIVTILVCVDGFFVMAVQHACGIFSAIGYRLEHLAEDGDLDINLHPERYADQAFWIVADCIKKHQEAINFVELLDVTYCWHFFCVTGCSIGSLCFSGFQAVMGLSSGDMDLLLGQLVFAGGQIAQLFFESFFSQRITDHGFCVLEALYQVRWFKTSIRTRKLLNFMILRSMVPCELKAGKIYTMSMANFGAVMRTAGSYFTALCSMR